MTKSLILIIALASTVLLTTAFPAIRQTSPGPCSQVCRISSKLCNDRAAFGRAMVQECVDDDTNQLRICSKCNGRTTNARDTLRNCLLLSTTPPVFGVPRGDVNVLANFEGVSVFDSTVRLGALKWRGDVKDSLICKAGSENDQTIFTGKVLNNNFVEGITAVAKGTVKNTNPFFGPRFLISKGGIAFTGETRGNKFGKLEAEGKITIRKTFENNKIKTMIARSGISVADSVKGNKLGRVNTLTPATAPDFESNFDVERIGFRGKFDDTFFTDNEAKLLRVEGSCNADDGSVIEKNSANRFRGDDKAGCGEIFKF